MQPLQFFVGSDQCGTPVRVGGCLDLHGQLNHLRFLQLLASDVHKQIADAPVGGCGELDDQTRVEAIHGADELFVGLPLPCAVCLVRLVEHHNGTEHSENVEEAVLDRAVLRRAFEIGVIVQQPGVTKGIVAIREECGIASRISEHAQELSALLPVGGGKHQQHDAQVVGGIRKGELVILLQQA